MFGDIGMPSAPTAVVSSNLPGMPSDVNDVAVTVPVVWERSRKDAVCESPGAIDSTWTVWFDSNVAPVMLLGSRFTDARLAGDRDVFVTVTSRSYSSPAVIVAGCGASGRTSELRTLTVPKTRPLMVPGRSAARGASH